MRALCLFAASLAVSAACTRPNPLWQATDAVDATSTDASSATIGMSDIATTSGESATTTDTGLVTTDAVTSGSNTTTDGSGTSGAMGCGFPDSPTLELLYTTTVPTGCDPAAPRMAHVEVLGQLGSNQWKFNICGSELVCTDPNTPCEDGEHVILTFDGPAELVPNFVVGACHEIVALAREEVPDDPTSCKLRVLRIAHTGFAPYATHYVGAISVPGTDGIPGMLDWFTLLGFKVVSVLDQPCVDALNCQPAVGAYKLDVRWGKAAVQHIVVEGQSFDEALVVSDLGQQLVEIKGTFTDVRSRIELGPCGSAQDFRWAWLAEVPSP